MMQKLSGLSYWEQSLFPEKCDVCIVGGGFTGLWTAFHLSRMQPSLKIVILEAHQLARSASTRNAGFMCYGSPSEILEDIETMGQKKAVKLVRDRMNGLEMIQNLISAEEIDMRPCSGYEYFPKQLSALKDKTFNALDELNALLQNEQCPRPFQPTSKSMGSGMNDSNPLKMRADITINGEGQLNPAKLVHRLNRHIDQAGVTRIESIFVKELKEEENWIQVYTDPALPFKAKKILIATNGLYDRLFPKSEKVKPAKNTVLMLQPDQQIEIEGNFHCDRGYVYFRQVDNSLLIGGGRHWVTDEEYSSELNPLPETERRLLEFARSEIFSDSVKLKKTISWAGTLGVGKEKSPVLQWESDRILSAVRLSGMGVALSPILAQRAAAVLINNL